MLPDEHIDTRRWALSRIVGRDGRPRTDWQVGVADEWPEHCSVEVVDLVKAEAARTCTEHDLPKPCLRCALLCPCGCDNLRDGVSEEVWEGVAVLEPFIRAQAKRDVGHG